jgi:hypothetical protein
VLEGARGVGIGNLLATGRQGHLVPLDRQNGPRRAEHPQLAQALLAAPGRRRVGMLVLDDIALLSLLTEQVQV